MIQLILFGFIAYGIIDFIIDRSNSKAEKDEWGGFRY